MTVTAKIQISVNTDNKVVLDKTMSVYSDACNYVSAYVFRTHDLKQFSLNKALYSTLREKFGLKSQMAQSVFKTVIARYKPFSKIRKNGLSLISKNLSMTLFGTGIILLHKTAFPSTH